MKNSILDRVRKAISSCGTATVSIKSSTINGDFVAGRSINITDKIVIDGNELIDLKNIGPVEVKISGSVEKLSVSAGTVIVGGDAGDVKTMSGDVEVEGMIAGNVETMSGDVTVRGGTTGRIKTMSGDVTVGR